jgi:hypothetical protein
MEAKCEESERAMPAVVYFRIFNGGRREVGKLPY